MAGQIHFEDVDVGDTIPPVTTAAGEVQLFLFSAATNNPHRIHYDRTYVREAEGYPDLLVHGPLQAALMAKTVTDWMGPQGRLVRFAVQNRGSAYVGEEMRFLATVAGKREENGRGLVDLDLREEKQGEVLMPGTATVALPRRG